MSKKRNQSNTASKAEENDAIKSEVSIDAVDGAGANGENAPSDPVESPQVAVENKKEYAKKTEKQPAKEDVSAPEKHESGEQSTETTLKQPVSEKQKSGGKGIALLALLVALGIGAAGCYFGHEKATQLEQQIAKLKEDQAKLASQAQAAPQAAPAPVKIPTFDAEKAQIATLQTEQKQFIERINQLEREHSAYTQQINSLQGQLQKLGAVPKAETTAWLLSDADFLLNNALRKVVLDNDIDTAKSLLLEADNVLSQVSDAQVVAVRDAIKSDLNQLSSVNHVDQNNLMQRLSQLANLVDDMPMVEDGAVEVANHGEVSDSIEDWQKNIEKSADSFLSHFIRVSNKGNNVAAEKAFIAPNQEIYLRENIRLRLQIAILTIPRQQNELYKQSLDAVGSWVRSYFDMQNENVKKFLKEIDELIEQSIYIDAPTRLQSFGLLNQMLNRAPKPIDKIQIDENKSIEQLKADEPKADESKADDVKADTPAEQAQPAPAQAQ